MARRKKPGNKIEEWEDIIYASRIRFFGGLAMLIAAGLFYGGFYFNGMPEDMTVTITGLSIVVAVIGFVLFAMGLHDWLMGRRMIQAYELKSKAKKKRRG